MPRIEVMNIKFNLDSNAVDAAVYAALCDIPRGKRSSVVKELLHAALCVGEATSLQLTEKIVLLPKRRDKPDHKVIYGSQDSRPLPYSSSHTSSRKTQSGQIEEKQNATSADVDDKDARMKGDSRELAEFRSLIY